MIMIMQFAWIAFNSVTAGVGNLIAEGDRDKVYAFFKVMRMCSFWIASYTCITLFYLTDGFIDMWLAFEKRYSLKPQVAFELLNEVRDVDPELWNKLADKTPLPYRSQSHL